MGGQVVNRVARIAEVIELETAKSESMQRDAFDRLNSNRRRHMEAIEQVGDVIAKINNKL